MKTLNKVPFFLFTLLVLGFSSSIFAQAAAPTVEEEVIALTYKIWKAENDKDMATRNKYISDDYTEFNSDYATRIDGKTKNFNLSDANAKGGTSLAEEMLNPKVQIFGDVAILSYNYAGVMKDNTGKVTPVKAKSTRVYVNMNGTWKLVHANFGADPNNNQ